jgi:hypothetical protein
MKRFKDLQLKLGIWKQNKNKPIKISKTKIGMRVILFDSCSEEDERENGCKRNSNTDPLQENKHFATVHLRPFDQNCRNVSFFKIL